MKGVVSSGHELTSKAGMKMFERGGNAFDAAVAAAFVSFVAESTLTSPCGGGFFMAHTKEGSTILYDFFSDVPGFGSAAGVKKKAFRFYPVDIDFIGTMQELYIGEGSAAVPGTVAGLKEVYERHCTLPIEELIAPAVAHAREGVTVSFHQAQFIETLSPMFTVSEESRAIYAPGGKFLREGDRLVNPGMADTFECFAEEGLDSFYRGEVARKVLEGFGERGLITSGDLENYRVEVRGPLRIEYRGRKIYTNPPPSSGGCLIAFALKLIEGFDLTAGKGLACNTAPYLKLLYEVM
ncbi:MAG: gamma-glutamyltransferase, partial [Thermodesulfobacteriota bacterium]